MREHDESGSDGQTAELVLRTLRGRHPPAALASELAVLIERVFPGAVAELDRVLQNLEADRAIVTVQQSAPDPHLESVDLRVIALVPIDQPPEQAHGAAMNSAEAVWSDWLRQFLATHRCA